MFLKGVNIYIFCHACLANQFYTLLAMTSTEYECSYISALVYNLHLEREYVYIYIYIYIYVERICVYIYIYINIVRICI